MHGIWQILASHCSPAAVALTGMVGTCPNCLHAAMALAREDGMSLTGRMDEDAVVRRRQQWRVHRLQSGRDAREAYHARAAARPGAGRALDAAGRRSSAAGSTGSDGAVAGEAEGARWLQSLPCAVTVMLCAQDLMSAA